MKYDFPKPVELISDGELDKLNQLLPWACFTVDSSGRKLGRAFSDHKRNDPQDIPDFRIVELNQRFALAGRSVLEMGCFEGVHTAALCQFGADVTAVDGRSEHVVKTQIRCGFYGHHPRIYCLDLEDHSMIKLPEFDVMVHIGVLYHYGSCFSFKYSAPTHPPRCAVRYSHSSIGRSVGELRSLRKVVPVPLV